MQWGGDTVRHTLPLIHAGWLHNTLLGLFVLALLLVTSRVSFLFFHSIAELLSIVVAWGIFVVARTTRPFQHGGLLPFLGSAYIFVGLLDLLHTLTYKGMGVFPLMGADTSTQLWIAARSVEAVSLLVAPFFLRRRLHFGVSLGCYALVTLGILMSIFWLKAFPACYVEGSGLTPFKKVAEYVIIGLLSLAMVRYFRQRDLLEGKSAGLIMGSLALTICSEISFTLYVSLSGHVNILGHFFKLASYYLIFKAFVEKGIVRPYNLLALSEEDLRIGEERLRVLIDSMPDLVCFKDGRGRLLEANRAYLSLLGLEDTDIRGWNAVALRRLSRCNGDLVTACAKGDVRAWEEGHTGREELEIRLEEGGLKVFDMIRVPLFHDDGSRKGLVIHGRDITVRKQAEHEREAMFAQLLQAQKMEAIGLLSGGVAHDFNNHLTSILGFTDLCLEDVDEGSTLHANLEEIHHAARRAASLTRQILLFARKQCTHHGVLDINTTIENLMKMITRLIGEDITIELTLQRQPWKVLADEGNIEQVIMNLTLNARDAMPEGGTLVLATENVELTSGSFAEQGVARTGPYVCLRVVDTGRGMDSATRKRAFDPFFSTKGPGQGTGLGLTVVSGIVSEHQGFIDIDTRPGGGTCFRVFLPATQVETLAEAHRIIKRCRPGGRGERILLVEDDAEVRAFTAEALGRNNYAVVEASGARQARQAFAGAGTGFDLLLSDVVLPGGSGIQLARELQGADPGLAVLMCSGYTDERSHGDDIRALGLAFMLKPYTLSELLETVRETLDGPRADLDVFTSEMAAPKE